MLLVFNRGDFPNITAVLRQQISPKLTGITQIRKRGLRDGGGTLSLEAAHSISVGAAAIALHLDRTCFNVGVLADFLEAHPLVSRVYYPGLKSHPQHSLASTFSTGMVDWLDLH